MSILSDLISTLTKPGRDIAELGRVVNMARQADHNINKDLDTLQKRLAASRKMQEYTPTYQTQEEQLGTFTNPVQTTLRNAALVGSMVAPVGVAGNIASRAGAGALAGGLGSYGATPITEQANLGKILGGAALGGAIGAATGGIEKAVANKAAKATSTQVETYLDDITDVKKVSALPKDAKTALKRLSESAGFKDPALSESQNILNYLNNRKLAGTTPGQTLENMTQEFAKATELKKTGLGEIGGLSKGYINNIKNQINESFKYSGLSATDTNTLNRMIKVLDNAPQDANTLDRIAQDWYKMGLTRAGEQKATQAGLYQFGAKAIRDALKEANASGSYTTAMSTLNNILGLQDEGAVSAAASQAEKSGFNIPIFQKAGVYGTDVTAPEIANTISKARAGMAENQLINAISKELPQAQGINQIPKFLEPLMATAQRTLPQAIGAGQQQASVPSMAPETTLQQTQQSPINELAVIQAVLNGDLSTTEANFIMDTLGGGTTAKRTEAQQDYQLASEALQSAYAVLDAVGGAGKLATLGGNVAGWFGSTTPSSQYRATLDTATAFLRKALIGSGQSEAELANLNLPKPTDEPAIAKQKIEALIPLLNARAGLQQY